MRSPVLFLSSPSPSSSSSVSFLGTSLCTFICTSHLYLVFPLISFMMHFSTAFLASLCLSSVLAAPFVDSVRSDRLAKRACENSASDRSCWGDYDLSTNYYEEVPDTGVTREYYFEVQNITAAPDGVERVVLCVNGTVPGPTIIADWGDTVGRYFNILQNVSHTDHF